MSDLPRPRMERIMALDRELRAGKYPNCSSFARDWGERFGYAKPPDRRTILRDLDWLRDMMGAPIAFDSTKNGFHYTDPSWTLPTLVALDERELVALLLAERAVALYGEAELSAPLSRTFDKLSALLARRVGHARENIARRFSFHASPNRPVAPAVWTAVARALLNARALRLAYAGAPGKAPSKRIVHPWHLANIGGEWYLTAYCERRRAARTFALSRIECADNAGLLAFDAPADFDPKKYYANRFERYVADPDEKPFQVTLAFPPDQAEWAMEKNWHPAQKFVRQRDGGVRLTLPMPSLWGACRWVLSWDGAVEVVAPAALRRMVAEKAAHLMRRYASPVDVP